MKKKSGGVRISNYLPPGRRLPERRIPGADALFSGACSDLSNEDRRAGGVTDAGGCVGATLVDGGSRVVERSSVVLSEVERSRLATGAGIGGENGRSSRAIGAAGGVSSAPSFP